MSAVTLAKRLSAVLVLTAVAAAARAQTPDPALLTQINRIQAIDDHSHPPRVVATGERDDEFDALPCDPLEPTDPMLMTRADNPEYVSAWKALWGYPYDDRAPAHEAWVVARKDSIRVARGDAYPGWVLDRLGIGMQLSNRIAMGRGLDAAHHRWVPFDDALIFPLNNAPLAAQTPDRKFFFSREDMLQQRYRRDVGVSALPATLAAYTARVVTPELERQKAAGAVAVKFEAAYLRSLDFGPAGEGQAAAIYGKYAGGAAPDTAEYRHLQDYLFHYVAREAGRLGMPVHIHTGAGCGSYFSLRGASPLLLEPVLNDPSLRKTNFVLLHGGAVAYTRDIAYLLMKPNVYTDMSQQTWMESPRELASVIRYWLEWYPEKVLFGTDLYPTGATGVDWEEVGWQTTHAAREALGIALTGMMNDGEVTRAQAERIARLVLRGNAARLYGWPTTP
jgi:uncharacterized protein